MDSAGLHAVMPVGGKNEVGRREFVRAALCAAAGMLVLPRAVRAAGAPVPITVYKTPSCGCCKAWVAHMQGAGFAPKVVDMDDLSEVKRNAGVPAQLQSCHTALAGKYVVEGHVPADLVQKMLKEKPAIVGLAVPGMVAGSPGMEQGNAKPPYEVIAFEKGGKTSVYATR
jgi:hypothetical protein